jgi:hypothetical protein
VSSDSSTHEEKSLTLLDFQTYRFQNDQVDLDESTCEIIIKSCGGICPVVGIVDFGE